MDHFCHNLSMLLKERNISQKQLASHLQVSPSTISKYITGERIPTALHLVKIARYLVTSLDHLLEIQTDSNKSLTQYPRHLDQLLHLTRNWSSNDINLLCQIIPLFDALNSERSTPCGLQSMFENQKRLTKANP